jgi:glycosyltransferase involved in cell wall biosynthesis
MKVSICIPTYNQTKCLRKTLDSISIQDFKDYEIIITDDSIDDSVEKILMKYDFGDRLKYFKNRSTLGSPSNWNKSLQLASGEYIKIMHHDDWFSKTDSLRKFVCILDESPRSDFAFCTSLSSKSTDTTIDRQPKPVPKKLVWRSRDLGRGLLINNIIGAPSSTIFRKNKLFFDLNTKWLVDVDFYMQALRSNDNFIYIDEPLVIINETPGSRVTDSCRTADVEFKEWLYVYNKYWPRDMFNIKELRFIRILLDIYNLDSIQKVEKISAITPNRKTLILLIFVNKIIRLVRPHIK